MISYFHLHYLRKRTSFLVLATLFYVFHSIPSINCENLFSVVSLFYLQKVVLRLVLLVNFHFHVQPSCTHTLYTLKHISLAHDAM